MPKALVNPVPVPPKENPSSEGPFREVNKQSNPFEDAGVKIEPMRRGRPAKSTHASQELFIPASSSNIPIFDDNFGQKMNNLSLNNDLLGTTHHAGAPSSATTPALGLQLNHGAPQSQFFQMTHQKNLPMPSPSSLGYPVSTTAVGMNHSSLSAVPMQPASMPYSGQPPLIQQPLPMQRVPSYNSTTSQQSQSLNPRLSQGSFQSVSPTNSVPFTPQDVFSNSPWQTEPTPPPKPPRVSRNAQAGSSQIQSPNYPMSLEVPNRTAPTTPTTQSAGSTGSVSRGDEFVSKMVEKFNKAP
jgi:hypothetical protein